MFRKVLVRTLVGVPTVVGGLLFTNYHLSSPPKDMWKEMEKELGHPPHPVAYPEEMQTTVLSKLVNSLGDTAYNVFGKQIFQPSADQKDLEDLKSLLPPEEFKEVEWQYKNFEKLYDMKDGDLNPVSQLLYGGFMWGGMKARAAVEKEYFNSENKEKLDKLELKPQIIITGLPRTGSTLMHQLLSQDPNCRFLSAWEMLTPLPFPTKETYLTDPRIEKSKKGMYARDFFCKNATKYYRMYHDNDGAEVEEEIFVLLQTGLLPTFFPVNNFQNKWYLEQNKQPQYKYLLRFLKLSQYNHEPNSHWVLKTPLHGYHFGELLETFDKNRLIVVTHRDPLKVVPSFCKLCTMTTSASIRDVHNNPAMCKEKYGKSIIDILLPITSTISRVRTEIPKDVEGEILDIEFSEIVKNPMAVVEKIYERAGLELTAEARVCMEAYLEKNAKARKESKGSHHLPYTLEEFGLTKEHVTEAFREYREARNYD